MPQKKSMTSKRGKKAKRMTMPLLRAPVTKIVRTCFSNSVNIPYWQDGGFGTTATPLAQAIQFYFDLTTFRVQYGTGVLQTYGYNLSANFAAIYDYYRMDAVEIQVFYNSNTSVVNNTYSLPILYGAIDTNDSGPLTSVANALSYPYCDIFQLGNSSGSNNGRQMCKRFTPGAESAVSATGGATQAALNSKGQWFDTANSTIVFYGYKIFADAVAPLAVDVLNGYITFIVKQYVSFKDQQ